MVANRFGYRCSPKRLFCKMFLDMDQSLYSYSLCAAIPLMLFFGFNMLFARVPERKIFRNFLLSRRIMGTAMLVLSANYLVHFFCSPRLKDVNATILMNLDTYFLCYWLFSSALLTLLNKRYITRTLLLQHLAMWIAFTALAAAIVIWVPKGDAQHIGIVALATWLVIYGTFLSVRMLRTYAKAVKMFRDNHSDDIGAYIRWLSIFTIWAIVFGVSCGLLTFLPDRYVFLWVLSAIPFYVYLFCSYQNYMLEFETVESAIEDDLTMEQYDELNTPANSFTVPPYLADLERRIKEWIEQEGFCQPGLTLKDLSDQLCTNRTYLSEYINRVHHVNFRDWITDLRIEFAKRRMKECPQQKMFEISESSGFGSLSHFTKTFSDKEGCTPARWRKSETIVGDDAL